MGKINTSSKLSLKMTCLAISEGDLEKAERMYDYFSKDMELPDVDPVMPSTFDQVKDAIGTFFGFLKDNRDDVAQALNVIQNLRAGNPVTTPTPIPPADIPPLPPTE